MITLINNQPIRLRNADEIDNSCECLGQSYCQLINKFDETQFQIKSSNLISNGNFNSNLDGWNIFEGVVLSIIDILNPSEDNCDGEIDLLASGGTGPYQYSKDGLTFQSSGIFSDLCAGTFTIIVIDSIGNESTLTITLDENVDCSTFAGSDTNDLLTYNTNNFLNCNTDDFI